MLRSGLKDALRERRLTVGSWMTFQFPPLAEMLARAGFDWVVIDLEHTSIDYHEAQTLMMVIENAGVPPLVRVGGNDRLIIKRVMDAGAHGILVPDVRSAAEARAAVEAMYYPPVGRRGAGLARAQEYGLGFDQYREWLEAEGVLIVQIEHVDAVAQLDDILSVDGVDGFMLGPYDLSASVGKPGQFHDPEVMAVFDQVAAAVETAPKAAGIHVVHPDPDQLRERIGQGYSLIAYGDDMLFYSKALQGPAQTLSELER
jgi:2-dehydro-3-deoxyglucarate aldolase